MSLSGEEIQRALQDFAARWHAYAGSERGEAQTFLNELFACYGVERREVGAEFEDAHSSTGIMDLHWPGRVIFEMKAPSRSDRLAEHRKQAIGYWRHSASVASGTPAPPYVVLCGFHRFEVWEPGRFPEEPRVVVALDDLSDRYEALLFLAGEEPLFIEQRRDLSVAAARAMNALYLALLDRSAAEPAVLRDFMLQSVWCFFAESLKLLPEHSIERIVEGLVENPHRSSAAELGFLFDALNQTEPSAKGGVYTGIPYANGGLFADPARVHLQRAELELYAEALRYDWRQVNPTIFGSILEGSLGDRRSELGIHYTHESDIMKIVGPTIVEPWTGRIASASTPDEAERALADLRRFHVLDPACGCGNFLYVAYRELRSLEQSARRRISDTYEAAGAEMPDAHRPGYPLANLHGIEVDEFAVRIARVVLWMGHKLAADRYGLVETVLPLVSLSNVVQGDALAVAWPEVSAIIGNPPFLGSQHLRGSLGDDYVEWLKNEFGCGLKDFCVYWFRRAADNLGPGCRAGLVGTNSVSQNRARSASLEFLVERGGVITNAVSSQKWPGEAKVHVSIVNWVHKPDPAPDRFVLDGFEVSGITTTLRAGSTRPEPSALAANRGRAFQGPIPVGDGFMVEAEEARSLLARSDADYSSVVRRYLVGADIAHDPHQEPTRWIIDFASMPLEDAMQYPAALAIVRERVKPERDQNRDRASASSGGGSDARGGRCATP